MKILIVGAGFGGLALAASLRRDGHSVTIVERKKNRPYKGFVMSLWRNGLHTLEPFGVIDRIHALGFPIVEEMIRDKTGKILATMDYYPLIERYGPVFQLLHADLYAILQELAEGASICYETSVQALQEESQGIAVTLSNGLRGEFDLVVGADGLHSWMRTSLFGNEGLSYSGVRIWFHLLPAGTIRLCEPNQLFGEGEYAFALPTRSGAVGVELLAAVPAGEPDRPEERITLLRTRFSDFGWMIPDILRALHDPTEIVSYPIDQVALEQWYRGRLVLLGDAAHGVSPTINMGCAMALEDAHVLAEELREVDAIRIGQALARYEARRKPRVEQIRKTSDFLLWWQERKEQGMVFLRDMGMHFASPFTRLSMENIIDARYDV